MKWVYCRKRRSNKQHLCAPKYSYKLIFKQMFINVLLDYSPSNIEDFYEQCVNVAKENGLVTETLKPFNIMWECLKIFVVKYDCFWQIKHVLDFI